MIPEAADSCDDLECHLSCDNRSLHYWNIQLTRHLGKMRKGKRETSSKQTKTAMHENGAKKNKTAGEQFVTYYLRRLHPKLEY